MMFQHVCIIGVGHIGGSLSRDLMRLKLATTISGFDTDEKNLRYVLKKKIISRRVDDLPKALAGSDLVVLATPVRVIEDQLVRLSPFIDRHKLVIDVGSTKEAIVAKAAKFFPWGNFVGCHPMAGNERSGPSAGADGLFTDAPCLLVAAKNSRPKFVAKAKALWTALGARVVAMDAGEHDRCVAACSHLPHVLSFALMRSVGTRIGPATLKKIAGGSFRSYTRIAGSNARMWADIFLHNRQNVLQKIGTFKKELLKLEKLMRAGSERKLFSYIEKSAELWRKM